MRPPRGETGLLAYVPAGERVILDIRPDPASIVLIPLGPLALIGAAAAAAAWLVETGRAPVWLTHPRIALAGGVLAGAVILWQFLEWLAKRYILTERRMVRVRGVLRQDVVDAPLGSVRHVHVFRSLRERLTGLGSIGFATAGTGGVEAYWVMVPRPREHLELVRRTVEAARGGGGGGSRGGE